MKLERCQSWFWKIIFYVPKFAPSLLLQRLSGLNSMESEIALRKLLLLGRLITAPEMVQSVRGLFMSRAESYFDAGVASMRVLPSIIEALNMYDLYHFFVSWFHDSTFPTYSNWKCIVKTKVRNSEDNAWADYCVNHPGMHIAQACLKNVTPYQFWCSAANYPDLVSRMHIQIRLMGNFGLNGGVPWHVGTNRSLCSFCKECNSFSACMIVLSLKKTLILYGSVSKPELRKQTPLMVVRFSILSVILTGLATFCCCSGLSHCHLITRRQFLSKDLFHQQSQKSLNCIRINYVSWRLRGLKMNEKYF